MENFNNLSQQGVISQQSVDVLESFKDIGAEIEAGMGFPAENINSSEAILVNVLLDDSGSMYGLDQDLIDGYNTLLDTLRGTIQNEGILIQARFLNSGLFTPYTPVTEAKPLVLGDFRIAGGTPLFTEVVTLLGTVASKIADFVSNGISSRSISLIMTDGENTDNVSINKVNTLITDLVKSEDNIVAAMGISNTPNAFEKIFMDMGIPKNWILLPNSTDIKQAFMLFSQSANRMSQGKSVQGFNMNP